MKICFLAGANSIHSKKWIKYFAERGHKIHWISLTPSTEGDIKNVKLHIIKGNLLFKAIYIKKLIKKINPDILHAHYAGINGIIGAFSNFHPFILTAWGSDVLIAPKSKIKKPLIKFALNKADLITCDADHMKEAIMRLGLKSSKIKIIYFGIDTQKFNFGKKNRELKNKLKLSNLPIVISLRNFETIYDIETLIKSIPLVLKKVPETKFLIAGTGSRKKKIKNLAKNLAILKNIKFLGRIANDKLPDYLRIADIYISTSLSDGGIASSTAEAMSCGLPVIITDTGENKKWVENNYNGYLIPVKKPKILADKIINLIKNENLREKFSKINQKIIKEKNDYLKEMKKMEKVYQKLVLK